MIEKRHRIKEKVERQEREERYVRRDMCYMRDCGAIGDRGEGCVCMCVYGCVCVCVRGELREIYI